MSTSLRTPSAFYSRKDVISEDCPNHLDPADSGFLKLWLIVRIERPLSLSYPFGIFGKLEMLSEMVKMKCIYTV